jgi:ribose transport system ATP-binding protein
VSPILSATNIGKSYGGVSVLRGVDFELRAGEVHALVGENGAGKSTLCRILCGITSSDAGTMRLRDRPYLPRTRREAECAGVRMVMQELNLLPTLTVAENIFLDRMPHRLGMIRYRKMNTGAAEALERVGLRGIASSQHLATLGVGQCQLVEIAAALSRPCDVLVLDEPTAALTAPEIALLMVQIRKLKSAGVGILYVSHRMEEIRAISDRITVLRDGQWIATRQRDQISHDETIRLMVGRDLSSARMRERSAPAKTAVAMSVRGLSRRPAVRDVSFDVHRGEILGFAGLTGSGRTETMRAIFGADRAETGDICLHGSDARVSIRSPRDAVRHGIALLTEDRKGQGLLLPLTIRSNVTLAAMHASTRLRSWISRRHERSVAQAQAGALSIRCRSVDQPVGELSGGNQQKVVLARWLLRDCDVLIFDEPTRGIDVGAKFEIYRLLHELASQGKAIVVVSSDLLELMAISDRIAVMSAGRLVRTFGRGEWTQEFLLEAALSEYSTRPEAQTVVNP